MSVSLDGYLIDEDMYEMLSQRKWKPDKEGYAVGRTRIGMKGEKRKQFFMHRIIMQAKEGEIVDHINGIVTDNRRENLRIVDAYQSSVNRSSVKGSTSKYKGVCRRTRKHKTGQIESFWLVRVKKHGKVVFQKQCQDEEQAARYYDEAALEHHGEYARLNFPKQA